MDSRPRGRRTGMMNDNDYDAQECEGVEGKIRRCPSAKVCLSAICFERDDDDDEYSPGCV